MVLTLRRPAVLRVDTDVVLSAVYGGGEGASQLGSNGWYTAEWVRRRLLGVIPLTSYWAHKPGSMHTRRPRYRASVFEGARGGRVSSSSLGPLGAFRRGSAAQSMLPRYGPGVGFYVSTRVCVSVCGVTRDMLLPYHAVIW